MKKENDHVGLNRFNLATISYKIKGNRLEIKGRPIGIAQLDGIGTDQKFPAMFLKISTEIIIY